MTDYPADPSERDAWIRARRPPRDAIDATLPRRFWIEEEPAESGEIVPVATLFLANRECPWRCLMCDLWRDTLPRTVAPGVIPGQIAFALAQLSGKGRPAVRQVKLYNSGSFFDAGAVPPADYGGIARLVSGFERVIVECHPSLVGPRMMRFTRLLPGPQRLEVAMGLETAQPDVLQRLNKRMTLDQFAQAAAFLRKSGMALRAFVLVKPPFVADEAEALHWAKRSIDFAFDCGAGVVSLIPTRAGNGALEELAARGHFSPPRLATLEAAVDYGLAAGRGRVFADLWDLEKFSRCSACFPIRRNRLERMNLSQSATIRPRCAACGE